MTIHEHNDHALFTLFYACKFCIHGKRRMGAHVLEDEFAGCVVLVFFLHDVLLESRFRYVDWIVEG